MSEIKVNSMDVRKRREIIISNLLKEVGIPASLLGYHYIKESIEIILSEPSYIRGITKRLYPEIAKLHNSTSSRVERAIRHAIEIAFFRGNINFLKEMFAYSIDSKTGKASNAEFLATIAEYIRLHYDFEE